jgi:hypothetical protein
MKVLALIGLTISISANAALVDLGDVTHDAATGLDWLDIDLTVQMTRSQVLASGYVTDQGYRYATLSELNTLYDNAGGNGFYLNEAGVANPENNSAALLLIDLMGCTSVIEGSPCSEVGGWGAARWGVYPGSPELQVGIVAIGGSIWTDWWTTVAIETRDDYGSYLVKTSEVPIPSAAWLFISAVIGMRALKRK